jgi:hypothetical protein
MLRSDSSTKPEYHFFRNPAPKSPSYEKKDLVVGLDLVPNLLDNETVCDNSMRMASVLANLITSTDLETQRETPQ